VTTTPAASDSPPPTATVELSPSYTIPVVLLLLALPLILIQRWAGGLLLLLALFLMIQTATIRLRFTESALEVWRGETCIRQFPYQNWQNWQIFWFNVPILLYFREVNSIHFLPILFNPGQLRSCLEQRCPAAQLAGQSTGQSTGQTSKASDSPK
jgi:hypothetical protein